MRDLALLSTRPRLPNCADAEVSARRRERWFQAAEDSGDPGLVQFGQDLAADPQGRALLDAVMGNSSFLAECAIAEPAFFRRVVENGPDAALSLANSALAELSPASDDGEVGRVLRQAKRKIALTTALADITNAWPLERVTGVLSDFAQASIRTAVSHLLRQASAAGAFDLPDPERPEQGSGLIVLGMGKLGGRELNYSSDIDLVVLFDPERIRTVNPDGLQNHFVRLCRGLVRLLEERTADGYVFRTDLRLRPDPGSTPLAVSTQAAEVYYETLGQNWERAAMIKARPVAGDPEAAKDCLEWLQRFIWRRNLDFAAIRDIHSIKRQIHAHRGGSQIALAAHNVKLGRGGIREIEFFVQTQQLIWGGREPRLRVPTTLGALQALVDLGRVKPDTAQDLTEAYEFLRRVEHRLQMMDDAQTHSLPDDEMGLNAFAMFMGYAGMDDFATDLLNHLRRVEEHYADLFEDSPSLTSRGAIEGSLVFTGADSDPETIKTLTSMGYGQPQIVDAAVRGWHHGRYRAVRTARARELLTELMPILLHALASTPSPDEAFLRFDRFLQQLPSGVQLFSMFHANPQLLELVAQIIGEAPRLADHLSHRPAILDSVLAGDFFEPPPSPERLREELSRALATAGDMEEVLDAARRWAHDRNFQVGVQLLHGSLSADEAGKALSAIVDTVLDRLLTHVEAEFARHHGRVEDGSAAIIALGKLGAQEMTPTSDLDLIMIYRFAEGAEASGGSRPLSPSVYFARLSQRLINAVTAQTGEGSLYEVDMRLRPSGNAGPIASSLEAFIRYHEEQAWTWEHMALTKARVVAGPTGLRRRIEGIIRSVLTSPRDADKLVADVADMRARIEKEFPATSLWDVKYLRGGLIDIEFIAQYLQLRLGATHPEVLAVNTRDALTRIGAAGLLDSHTIVRLIATLDLWHAVQGLLRLTMEGRIDEKREEEMSPGLRAALCRAGGAVDFADLKARIRAAADAVFKDFQTLIDIPAQAMAQRPGADGSPNEEEQP
jgi:glutamate-ammonia-ligase adenylyltransferase